MRAVDLNAVETEFPSRLRRNRIGFENLLNLLDCRWFTDALEGEAATTDDPRRTDLRKRVRAIRVCVPNSRARVRAELIAKAKPNESTIAVPFRSRHGAMNAPHEPDTSADIVFGMIRKNAA